MDVMEFLEPITAENLSELSPGEWIWDNSSVLRRVHNYDLSENLITEPAGFRQIHILDTKEFYKFGNKPFMLTSLRSNGYEWVYFIEDRFYRFKRKEN